MVKTSALADDPGVAVKWTASNNKVVGLMEQDDGRVCVYAKAAGTATITCAAMDGSGKKATTKVTVITPASGITMTPGKGTLSAYYEEVGYTTTWIGYGGSTKVNIVPSDAYGKPSVSKVDVQYIIGFNDDDGKFIPIDDRYQEFVIKNKLFISYSGGKVSVKNTKNYKKDLVKFYKKFGTYADFFDEEKHWAPAPAIMMTAWTTDGTEYSDVQQFKVINNASYLVLERFYAGRAYNIKSDTILLSAWPDGYSAGSIYSGMSNPSYSVVSSNPNVATASAYYKGWNDYYREYEYSLDVVPKSKGTAKITITALDGTGKKITYTVKVK